MVLFSEVDGSNKRERPFSEKVKEKLVDNGDMVLNQYAREMVGFDDKNAGIGSMVAVVKSLESITAIQERMDVDGGLISLSPLGGRQFLLIERVQGYLSDYRPGVLDALRRLANQWAKWYGSMKTRGIELFCQRAEYWFLSSKAGTISKSITLKVNETLLGMVGKAVDVEEDDIICPKRVFRLPIEGWTEVSSLVAIVATTGLED
ncbi:hypothetical protein SLEP1_g19813 [Rubroshorea leprosula]|uniref:Uncharacterized protein n=1 Tax=Rubroshorea leprosula TaxID=152421 RepID=A0AAV5J9U7_9ROSI|nr:hypothetical protein SLEP1_g19813 [Rubroshorea leprosula]